MTERQIELDSLDTALLVFGSCDENIRLLEQEFGVTAVCRGSEIKLTGEEEGVESAARAVDAMLTLIANKTPLEEQTVRYCISLARSGEDGKISELTGDFIAITTKGRPVRPKTLGQKRYLEAIGKNSITFGVGPAGTGKTYLAVAMAVKAFKARRDQPHHPHPAGGGGRGEAGISARRSAEQGGPLSAPPLRRPV